MGIIINNVRVCEPVDSFLKELANMGFTIVEQYVSDYHFSEVYIKVKGDLRKITNLDYKGLTLISGKYICDCHWSTIEIEGDG